MTRGQRGSRFAGVGFLLGGSGVEAGHDELRLLGGLAARSSKASPPQLRHLGVVLSAQLLQLGSHLSVVLRSSATRATRDCFRRKRLRPSRVGIVLMRTRQTGGPGAPRAGWVRRAPSR